MKCDSSLVIPISFQTLLQSVMCLKGYEPNPSNRKVGKSSTGIPFKCDDSNEDGGMSKETSQMQVNGCRNNFPATSSDRSNLWEIHGRYYDISENFVKVHPGGSHAILLGKGRDCTALFESYHPFTKQHTRRVLAKYEVVSPLLDCDRCDYKNDRNVRPSEDTVTDEFYDMLKQRVEKHLRENHIDPIRDRCATLSRLLYYSLILCCTIYTGFLHCQGFVIKGSFLFGIFGWLTGSLGHDGGHFSVHRNPIVNKVCTNGMFLLCNPIMWQYQHTYAHHSHTNDFDKDPDLHHFTVFLRYHKKMIFDRIYKRQESVLYIILTYTFVTFGECIKIPWGALCQNSIYGIIELEQESCKQKFSMLVHIALYIYIVLIVPWMTTSSLALGSLCASVHMVTTGLHFAFFSQINHINEDSILAAGSEERREDGYPQRDKAKDTWAITQVKTSNNFAPDSYFW